MSDQIEEVKQKTDIVSLISDYVELKKAGRNYKALCPFHSEKTPSFMVSPELQIFKCFGCQKGGDAIAFLQEYEGMDFGEALKFLADRVGVKLKPFRGDQKSYKEKLYEINSSASYFFSWILKNHALGKPALDYLQKERKIAFKTIEFFKLGFSPENPLGLKKFLVDKKKIDVGDLEKVGLIYFKDGQLIDRFRGRIIFPLFDHRGNIVGFSGRVLPKDENSDLAKYINTPETEIYHKSKILYGLNFTKGEIKKRNEAVIMEGDLDVISSWQAGIKNVVAVKGSGLTEDQVRLISRFSKRLVLALDMDPAGDEAARRAIMQAEVQGLEVRVARLKGFKDPDEAARKNPKALKDAIQNSLGVWDFLIASVFSRYKGETGTDKAKISRELVPILAAIPDRIVQAHYVSQVAKKLDVPVDAVFEQIEVAGLKLKRTPSLEIARPEKKSRQALLEERLLTIAFRFEPKLLLKNDIKESLQTPLAKRIFEEFLLFFKKHRSFDPSLFASELPKELVQAFTDMVLKDIKEVDEESANYEKEFELVKKELKALFIKNELKDLAKKIQLYEGKGENGELQFLEEKFGVLTKKLQSLTRSRYI